MTFEPSKTSPANPAQPTNPDPAVPAPFPPVQATVKPEDVKKDDLSVGATASDQPVASPVSDQLQPTGQPLPASQTPFNDNLAKPTDPISAGSMSNDPLTAPKSSSPLPVDQPASPVSAVPALGDLPPVPDEKVGDLPPLNPVAPAVEQKPKEATEDLPENTDVPVPPVMNTPIDQTNPVQPPVSPVSDNPIPNTPASPFPMGTDDPLSAEPSKPATLPNSPVPNVPKV